jgi:predicted outer membrane repeat protein
MFNNGREGESSPTLTNVTFSGNRAGSGGAMHNDGWEGGESSPTLTDVTFSGNRAKYGGGAIYNGGENSPALTNVTFSGNWTEFDGGAMYNSGSEDGESSPTLTNITFTGNWAEVHGGAIFNHESSPTLTNVTFTGNTSAHSGGAIYDRGNTSGKSNPTLTNVIFTANGAEQFGGAMFNEPPTDRESSPTLTNVTFSGNWAGNSGGAIANSAFWGGKVSPALTNVTFAGNSANSLGGAIYNIAREDGKSSLTLTNVILWNNSAGQMGAVMYNNAATVTIAYSLVQDGLDGSGINNSNGGGVIDDGGNIDANPLFVSPVDPGDAPTTAGDLRLRPGSPAIDAGDNSVLPAGLTATLDGSLRTQGAAVDMGAYEFLVPLHVKAGASPGGNGSSWEKAFTNLQDALVWAIDGSEIWVATGVYTPGVNVVDSFNISSGAALYGGFAGTETERDQRDWEANPTVLSGDIGGDDKTDMRGVVTDTAHITGNNVNHVLMLDGTTTPITASTRIDGVIITAGQATGGYPDNQGGGLYCNGRNNGSECSPTLTNITFVGNFAKLNGGAVVNDGDNGISRPTLTNVTFISNSANVGGVPGSGGQGGAIYNDARSGISSPVLTNVTFIGNSAHVNGGAMANYGSFGKSNPELTNVTFTGNWANNLGGAMFNNGTSGESSPTLTNVTFSGNWTQLYGGAMTNISFPSGKSSPSVTNAIFSGNSAKEGGAIYNLGGSSPILTNVTFAGNWADEVGGAITSGSTSGTHGPTLRNVILWGNRAGSSGNVMANFGTTSTIAHSLVEGGWNGSGIVTGNGGIVVDGGGNIDADPLFVIPVDPASAPTTVGDLRLRGGSPAIDAGDSDALPAGLTIDLEGNPRIHDGDNDGGPIVDMGAYEFMLPLIGMELVPTSVVEDSGEALTATFTRTVNTTGVLTVTFNVGGSATPDIDYTQSGAASFDGSSGSLTFGDGVITRTMRIIPTLDFVVELDETVAVTVSASSSYSLSVPSSVTGVIVDDDSAGVIVDPIDGLSTTESGGTATFSVTLQSEPTGTVTVTLASDDPTEGTVNLSTLTFNATNWNVAQTVTVSGVDDDADDGDIAYTIETAVSSDDAFYDGIEADDVSVTNLDDDGAGVTVIPSGNLTTTESGGTATFDVVLQSEPAGTVTVTVTSSDPTEGTVSPTTLTFNGANWNVAQTITATGVDDDVDDGHVAYAIQIQVSSDDPDYDGIEVPDVQLVNLNDDYYLFLPLIGSPPGLPDLVVGELSASGNGVTVVVANVGESAVVDPFWVDVYIDPDPVPTAPNQTWPLLAEEGLVWGVTDDALPLQPGQSLTLTLGDAHFDPDESHFSGAIVAGSALYGQVDSAHTGSDHGAVLEAHEADGALYNNIAGPVAPAATVNVGLATPEAVHGGQNSRLPPRR